MVAPSDSLDDQLLELEQTFQTQNSSAMENASSDRNLDEALSAFQNQTTSPTPPQTDKSARALSPQTDALLSEFLTEFDQKQVAPSESASATDAALAEFAQQAQTPPSPDLGTDSALAEFTQSCQQTPQPAPTSKEVDSGLAAIAGQFQAKPKPAAPINVDRALDSQAQQMQRQKHKAWTAQQYRLRLEKKAKEWLAALDPYSDEGLWFTEFASHYPSKLDAAMEYIDTLVTGNQQSSS